MPHKKDPDRTVLESADEIIKALAARKERRQAETVGLPPALPAQAVHEVQRDRPVQRPPMAQLCIFDDGATDGEWVRLRADRTAIGRTEGDVLIPHDAQISNPHAEIARERTPQGWRWLLSDRGSAGGTFVRIGSTPLLHSYEFLIGQGRYRFDANPSPTGVALGPLSPRGMPQPPPPRPPVPLLIEYGQNGLVQRHPLSLNEYWIGSDTQACAIARPGDPFADALHARLYRDGARQWHVENLESINGLWLRVKTIVLERACQFRLGEQRFHFQVFDA